MLPKSSADQRGIVLMRSTCPFLTRNTAIFCSLTALTLAGCASIEPAGHATSDAVTMRFVQTDRPDLGADTCQIAVEASYPADMPTHERTLTIRDTASTIALTDGPLTLPRPADDSRASRSDGIETFTFSKWTLGGTCKQKVYDIAFGPCRSSDCTPWQFVDRGSAPAVTFRVRGGD
jgi:hypothetical protein